MIQRSIVEQFENSAHHELRGLVVDVDDQRIILSGTVPTYYLKQVAQETARQACPRRKVDNDLAVATRRPK